MAGAALAAGREVVVIGRAMDRVVQVARETGYFDGVQEFRGAETYGYLPPDKVLALCTGSQGEPRPHWRASPRTSTPRSRSARVTAWCSPRA